MPITPNQVTVLRVGLAFVAVALFGLAPAGFAARYGWVNLVALGLIIAAIALDAVDGWLARRYRLATPLGAQLDILGDRVIENLFFTFFAVCGLVSLWVPVTFFVRGTLTDFLRGLAARAGKSGFGRNSMLEMWWGRALVASRASRGAYAALKCLCFCFLGAEWALLHGAANGFGLAGAFGYGALRLGQNILVSATVGFCLVRALPVVWEGRRYLAAFDRSGAAKMRLLQPRPTRASQPHAARAASVQ